VTSGFCSEGDFCAEFAHGRDNAFSRIYGEDAHKRVLLRTESLLLLADMSPLAEGHLLLVSRHHYLNFGAVIEDYAPEVDQIMNFVEPRYRARYGKLVLLEHGSSLDMDFAACISHAHWHLLPLSVPEVDRIIDADSIPGEELPSLRDLTQFARAEAAYFMRSDWRTSHRLFGVGRILPRQYLRSLAGRLLNIPDPEWDYAVVTRKELLYRTTEGLAQWQAEFANG
jgi:diadenosine tetraphosphate (Ap4A) HIT family hydrolase